MTSFKNYLICFLVLAACAAGVLAAHYQGAYQRCSQLRRPLPAAVSASPFAVPVVDTYTDASGIQHTVLQTPEAIGRQQAERVVYQSFRPILDSVSASVGIKPKELDAYSAVQVGVIRDSVRFLCRMLDNERRTTRRFQDKYLTLLVRDPALADTTDPGSFDFAYNAELRTVDYSRRKKFLGMRIGRREYYTDLSSSDPRMKIKGADRLTLQRRVPSLGVRLQALTSYNLESKATTLGVGLRFDAGDRFNAGVNYTYNFLFRSWAPTLYAKYDLLQVGR